jgi:hypothetical protein
VAASRAAAEGANRTRRGRLKGWLLWEAANLMHNAPRRVLRGGAL